jgi:hypothetical protein
VTSLGSRVTSLGITRDNSRRHVLQVSSCCGLFTPVTPTTFTYRISYHEGSRNIDCGKLGLPPDCAHDVYALRGGRFTAAVSGQNLYLVITSSLLSAITSCHTSSERADEKKRQCASPTLIIRANRWPNSATLRTLYRRKLPICTAPCSIDCC